MLLSATLLLLSGLACRDIAGLSPESLRYSLDPNGTITVSPSGMHGWSFYDDQHDSACTDSSVCTMVDGPSGQPIGGGSAELATPTIGAGTALMMQGYRSTRFDSITELSYSTYRQSIDLGNNLAISLQFNVDYDLTDQSTGYQGRIVFEPYHSAGGAVLQNSWQRWDAMAGKWWGTKSMVPRGGISVTNPCVQATPCTWSELLAAFPNMGVHATYGIVVLKAGSGWAGFRGNVDKLSIGVSGSSTTYDFELHGATPVALVPPDSVPHALFDSLGVISGAPLSNGPYRKDIVVVEFRRGTSLGPRQAAIDSVGGEVVGGKLDADGRDGAYYILIRGGTTATLLNAVRILQRQPDVAVAYWWDTAVRSQQLYRRPTDGEGWRSWEIDPVSPNASRINWALEYVRAPMAWGCSIGGSTTKVAVVDEFVHLTSNIARNVDTSASVLLNDFDPATIYGENDESDHGARVASILAARGDDTLGMTGMAWRADLILRDRFSLVEQPGKRLDALFDDQNKILEDHIVAAGEAGASIINLSLGLRWPQSRPYDPENPEHVAEVATAKGVLVRAIDRLAAKSSLPLFVIAAGNDSLPAGLSGYAKAKEDYPARVLVVGGLGTDRAVWPHSNLGPLVDVYAPSVRVAQANGSDRIVSAQSGTSFAAPLVSGVAVLLKDFDPSLTANDLASLITQGAKDQSGIKKLDAYQALKLAAESPGAPLCGNRVYKAGDAIYALRGDTKTPEAIISLPFQTPDSGNAYIDVYHGGKRVDLGFSDEYDWKPFPRGFAKAAEYTYSDTLLDGGTFLSAQGLTHNYEMHATANLPLTVGEASLVDYNATLSIAVGGRITQRIAVGTFPTLRPSARVIVGQVPLVDEYEGFLGSFVGTDTVFIGSWVQPQIGAAELPVVAIAPSGKYALVAVNFVTRTNDVSSDFKDCRPPSAPNVPAAQCKDGGWTMHSDHVAVYRLDIATGTSRLIKTLTGTGLSWMALSEREDELVWQTQTRSINLGVRYAFYSERASYEYNTDSVRSALRLCTGKALQYLAFDSSATSANPVGAATRADIQVEDGCNDEHSLLAGTMSPSRTFGQGGLGLQSVMPSASAPGPQIRRATRKSRVRALTRQ